MCGYESYIYYSRFRNDVAENEKYNIARPFDWARSQVENCVNVSVLDSTVIF